MNSKLRLAQSLFDLVDGGHTTFDAISKLKIESGNPFRLTELELREASPALKDFVIKNNFLIPTIDAYGFTEPYEDFQYSFDRLKMHLDISNQAFYYLEIIVESGNKGALESLELDWDEFEEKLNLTSNEIIYEQSLITLLTIFEAYITHILQWIMIKDEASRQKGMVNIALGEFLEEVFSNLDGIIDFLVSKKIEQIRSWNDRINVIQSKPIEIEVKDKPEYKLIKDAIAKRNILIHNKGKANKKFLKEIKNNDLSEFDIKNDYSVDDKVIIDGDYFNQVEKATEDLVKYIDDKVKEKYS